MREMKNNEVFLCPKKRGAEVRKMFIKYACFGKVMRGEMMKSRRMIE